MVWKGCAVLDRKGKEPGSAVARPLVAGTLLSSSGIPVEPPASWIKAGARPR